MVTERQRKAVSNVIQIWPFDRFGQVSLRKALKELRAANLESKKLTTPKA
jgi:hypothetical protein